MQLAKHLMGLLELPGPLLLLTTEPQKVRSLLYLCAVLTAFKQQ